MMISIMGRTETRKRADGRDSTGRRSAPPGGLWAVFFWLAVWQAAGFFIRDRIFFVTPAEVAIRLFELASTRDFAVSVLRSFIRIAGGFLLAALAGTGLAAAASGHRRIRELLAPAMLVIRTVPVVSFIILALILFTSKNLSVLISFLMGLPVIYKGVLAGIDETDPKLREMAAVFRIPEKRRFCSIEIPQIQPYFRAAAGTACGLCWKAGAAAEVIGIPQGSIGEKLQQAKVYLETADLFAWTVVIVLLSLFTQKLFIRVTDRAAAAIAGVPAYRPAQQPAEQSAQRPAEQAAGVNAADPGRLQNTPVAFAHVCRIYAGRAVPEDFSDVFPGGQVTAVLAPSGSGKTTLLRLAAGLEKPDRGTVSGTDGRRFAFVFQEDRLIEGLDAEDNIRLAAPAAGVQEVHAAMREFGLDGSCCGRPVKSLSGGEKRRIAILRALLSDWDILLLDEPFTGLDEKNRHAVIAATRKRCAGRTVIFVTHDPSEPEEMGAAHTAAVCAAGEE